MRMLDRWYWRVMGDCAVAMVLLWWLFGPAVAAATGVSIAVINIGLAVLMLVLAIAADRIGHRVGANFPASRSLPPRPFANTARKQGTLFGRRMLGLFGLILSFIPVWVFVVLPLLETMKPVHTLLDDRRDGRALFTLFLGAWSLGMLKLHRVITATSPEERRLDLRDRRGQPLRLRDALPLLPVFVILFAYTAEEDDLVRRFGLSGPAHAAMSAASVLLAGAAGVQTYRLMIGRRPGDR